MTFVDGAADLARMVHSLGLVLPDSGFCRSPHGILDS
jgi:hypothetical protein